MAKGLNKTTRTNLRVCAKGHRYNKTSDCPTCPVCEAAKKDSASAFLSRFHAPARRALENNGIKTVKELSQFTEKQILSLHGMGKASLPALRKVLSDSGLDFKQGNK
jgi:DNA-directed RNA polymerase alpha subunit